MNKDSIIADIGSGTGISSQLFLQNNNTVFAVEPNAEMRSAAELQLAGNKNFISINGTAEATTLADNSIDIIFCAQAFHWFDKAKTKLEFNRILKANGHIAIVWNARSLNNDFQKAYEKVLKTTLKEYKLVTHRNIDESAIADFLAPQKVIKGVLSNHQNFDLVGLQGRVLSSSYCPKEGPEHDNLMIGLETLFNEFSKNGTVRFEYETEIYCC